MEYWLIASSKHTLDMTKAVDWYANPQTKQTK